LQSYNYNCTIHLLQLQMTFYQLHNSPFTTANDILPTAQFTFYNCKWHFTTAEIV